MQMDAETAPEQPMGRQMDTELTCAPSVGSRCQTWIRCRDHWCCMTLSNDDEWKEKAHLTSMGLQMDTDLQMELALAEPLPNVDL